MKPRERASTNCFKLIGKYHIINMEISGNYSSNEFGSIRHGVLIRLSCVKVALVDVICMHVAAKWNL